MFAEKVKSFVVHYSNAWTVSDIIEVSHSKGCSTRLGNRAVCLVTYGGVALPFVDYVSFVRFQ